MRLRYELKNNFLSRTEVSRRPQAKLFISRKTRCSVSVNWAACGTCQKTEGTEVVVLKARNWIFLGIMLALVKGSSSNEA